MRRSAYVVAAAMMVACMAAGCSRHDDQQARSDARDTGQSIHHAVAGVANDPDVRSAAADLRTAGHDAAKDVRKAAEEAKVAARKLASDTRGAAHDVVHSDRHSRTDSGDSSDR